MKKTIINNAILTYFVLSCVCSHAGSFYTMLDNWKQEPNHNNKFVYSSHFDMPHKAFGTNKELLNEMYPSKEYEVLFSIKSGDVLKVEIVNKYTGEILADFEDIENDAWYGGTEVTTYCSDESLFRLKVYIIKDKKNKYTIEDIKLSFDIKQTGEVKLPKLTHENYKSNILRNNILPFLTKEEIFTGPFFANKEFRRAATDNLIAEDMIKMANGLEFVLDATSNCLIQ
ncbi:MAG: hypothetical protein HRT87_12420 [Legionellales bacterium]|nr:hypothetical protein [Legionellales bacterium]